MSEERAQDLLSALNDSVVIFDGGMGTQLLAAGLTTGENSITWNAEHPDVVRGVHERYLSAGCQVVTTNTFQGTRTVLATHGLDTRCAELNRSAAALAREAADAASETSGTPAWVAADVGPFGGFLEPLGDTTTTELQEIFAQQLHALYEGGADVALIETMSDPAEVEIAIAAARAVADWPIIATYAFQAAGDQITTMMGSSPAETVTRAIDAGAQIVGANCGTGLGFDDYLRLGGELTDAAGSTPVIVQANAGAPRTVGMETVYDATPEDMAAFAPRLAATGVRAIGGCCGTTPDHLAAMATVLHAGASS